MSKAGQAPRREKIIGQLMKWYRRSPLHSAGAGRFLAGIMSRWIVYRNPVVIKEIDGTRFELDLREVIDASLYFSGTFEEDVEAVIRSLVQPGMRALDIGANIGYHTFRMARLAGKGGQVYAIEPTGWAFQKLLRNSELNPELDNITFSKVGLGDADAGPVRLDFQSSYRLDGTRQSRAEEVELLTLDSYLESQGIRQVDFIKLDVDGFEGKIIRGGLKSLTAMRPAILMELNPSTMLENGDDPAGMLAALAGAGYRFETLDGHPIRDPAAYCLETRDASTMVLARPANA
jgi:FkbM family methyltransferase